MSKVDNISLIPVTEQVRNLPADVVEEFKKLFETKSITMGLILEILQDRGLIAEGVNHKTFHMALAKIHNFKQQEQQSHGYIASYPQHMSTWDYEKNSEAGLDPAKLTLGSNKKAFFKCPNNLHPSEQRIIRDQIRGKRCNKCKYEAHAESNSTPTKGVNDLATKRPDLVPFWSDRNDRQPDEVCYSSNEKFWWVDKYGNEYINRPNDRVKKPTDWSPFDYWKEKCPDHYEVFEYIRNIVPQKYPVLIEQMMLPESKEMTNEGYKQSLFVDIVVLIGPFKLLFEVNGSEHFSYGKRYHDRKVEAAAELGHTLTHIWSHIWVMDDSAYKAEIKNQIEFLLSYQTGTKGNEMVARNPVKLDGEVAYRGDAA